MSRFLLFSTVKMEMHTELSSHSGRMVQVQHTWGPGPWDTELFIPVLKLPVPRLGGGCEDEGAFPLSHGCPFVLLLVLLSGPLGPGPSLQRGTRLRGEIRAGGGRENEKTCTVPGVQMIFF